MTDAYVRPDTAAFLTFLNAQTGPKMHEMPLADARNMMVAMRHVADAPRGEIALVKDMVIPGPAGDIRARLYDNRPDRAPGLIMVFYHGGGFVIGDLETHDPYCAEAARQLDMPVIAIDYRLAPEHPFPAAPEDCIAATRWVADTMAATGMVLCGDSAGGNLTAVVAMALRDKPAKLPVVAQLPWYPAVAANHSNYASYDAFKEGFLLTEDSMIWFGESYAADQSALVAPLNFDLAGMPPAVVVTAGLDPLRDQGRAYAAKLIEAGVETVYHEASGSIHGFINLQVGIPSTKGDIKAGHDALKTLLAKVGV